MFDSEKYSVFKIGSVESVDGRTVKVRVDKNKNSSHFLFKGELLKNVSVGGFVKVIKGFIPIIASVESEYIIEDKQLIDADYTSKSSHINRYLQLKLLGYLEPGKYIRGIKELPLVGNECFLLDKEEYELIHHFDDNNGKTASIVLGKLHSDDLMPVCLGVQSLFSKHIGIFGNTGSGKSYTITKLYSELFKRFSNNKRFVKNSKFLFFDFNGEYSGEKAITKDKYTYNLTTRKESPTCKIPLHEDSWLSEDVLCIFANATEKTQRPFIVRCVDLCKRLHDDTVHFKNLVKQCLRSILNMADRTNSEMLLGYIENILPNPQDDEFGLPENLREDFAFNDTQKCYYKKPWESPYQKFQTDSSLCESLTIYKHVDNYIKPENRLEYFIHIMYLQLILDVLSDRARNEHIAPAIQKLKSSLKNIGKVFEFTNNDFWKHHVVVVNMNDVNLDMKKMIPMLLAHSLYKEHQQSKATQSSYLNLIVDEAHNILSYQSNRESENWKDYRLEVFEEIIKEGRKFGVFMTIASQRPSDISSTIISQLHNYFVHRLVNEKDIEMVSNAISYLDKISVESLPILPTGTCVIAGQLSEMPIVVDVSRVDKDNEPDNKTLDIVSLWTDDSEEDVEEVFK